MFLVCFSFLLILFICCLRLFCLRINFFIFCNWYNIISIDFCRFFCSGFCLAISFFFSCFYYFCLILNRIINSFLTFCGYNRIISIFLIIWIKIFCFYNINNKIIEFFSFRISLFNLIISGNKNFRVPS